MTLIKKSLGNVTTKIHCEDRFVVAKISNCLFINVYLPCSGTPDRQAIYENLLDDICFGAIVIMTVNALLVAILM